MGKNIAFDLRALQIGHENRGIGMVVRSILERIDDQENTYFFYAFEGNDPIQDLGIELKISYTLVQTPRLSTQVKTISDLKDSFKLSTHGFGPLRALKINTFVQFDAMLGLPHFFGTKTVLVAYDLIPLILKNEYLPTPSFAFSHTSGRKAKIKAVIRSLYYIMKFKVNYSRFKRADSVIAISETVRQSFIDLLHVKPGRIHTLTLAPVVSTDKEDDSIIKRYTANKPYILYVGGTDSRKRIEDIVYAFNITRGRGSELDLILAGNELKSVKTLPDIAAQKAILDSPYRDGIHFAGFVTDEQKNSLYKNAHAFVFCSIYEGFGLPVIEAQQKGCPVISYSTDAIKEVAGESAVLVPVNSYVQVAENIGRLFDPVIRKELIKSGSKNAEKYTWDSFIKGFLKEIIN